MRKTLLICASILTGSCIIAYACQLNGRYQAAIAPERTVILDTRTGIGASGGAIFDASKLSLEGYIDDRIRGHSKVWRRKDER